MPSGQEIVSSLYAAWRLLRGDVNALQYLNQSIDGFWRSFFAIVLIAPMMVIITLMHGQSPAPDASEAELGTAALVAFRLISSTVAWLSFPLAMIWVSRALRLEHRYVVYIIAWNWSNVIGTAILLALSLFLSTGIFPKGIAAVLVVFVYGYVLFYAYLVTIIGLACSPFIAIVLVIGDTVLEVAVDLSVDSLLKSLV